MATHPTTGTEPTGAASPDAEVDLFDLGPLADYAGFVLHSPLRNKRLALSTLLVVAALGVLALLVMPIRWVVTGSILAQRSPLMATLSNPGLNRDWDTPTRSARELLIRRDNLETLVKQTNLVERYLATRAPVVRARDWVMDQLGRTRTQDDLMEGLIDTLETRLWLQVGPDGATLNIGFEWSDKEVALLVVQAAIQGFIEERYATELKMVGETISILQGHDSRVLKDIADTITQVEEKERAVRVRTRPRPVAEPRPRAPQDEELTRLESTLAARRRAVSDLEEFRRQRLADLQTQLAQQLATYAPEHPIVVSTRRAIDGASAPSPQIEALRLEVIDLERQIARRGGRTDGLAAPGSSVSAEWAQVARMRLEAEDPRLEYERRALDMLLRQHSQLLERIDAARIEMDTAQAAFKYRYTVVTPPQLPRSPKRPYALLFVGGGIVGGLVLALFVSTLVDLRSGRVLEGWQVDKLLRVPLLAEIKK